MRFLAIDLGDKRTGLAVGDDETGHVFPVGVVEVPMTGADAGARLLDALARAVDEHLGAPAGRAARAALVIGLPINMDGTEGPRAMLVREFGARLGARAGLAVHPHDERLTSAQADWDMARSGLTRGEKKQRRDALAAAAILRDFLASRKGSPQRHGDTEKSEEG